MWQTIELRKLLGIEVALFRSDSIVSGEGDLEVGVSGTLPDCGAVRGVGDEGSDYGHPSQIV
jgi:hypothetical protein